MVTFRNNNRRNNFRRNDRGYKNNNSDKSKFSTNLNGNENYSRKNNSRNNFNASKLFEKYSNLAREALSSGDKILSENYFQHADHFKRIINENEIIKKAKFEALEEKKVSQNIIDDSNAMSDEEKGNALQTESDQENNQLKIS